MSDKLVDVEGLPDYDHDYDVPPKWHRQRRSPSRRNIAIAGVLALAIPTFLFTTVDRPFGYLTLPSTRPRDSSLCDYYAQRSHYFNTASAQRSLVATIVDKAFLGAKHPERLPHGKNLHGILRPGEYLDRPVDLLRYFDGSVNSTNVAGVASRVSFVAPRDDGRGEYVGNCRFHGVKERMYRYFAATLQCSAFGNTVDRYTGRSMADIHKFMNFEDVEWAYFIAQFNLGALAAGFSERDAALFELYLVDSFGPKIDGTPVFGSLDNDNVMPPRLDEESLVARAAEIVKVLVPGYNHRAAAAPDDKRPAVTPAPVVKRQNPSRTSTPPPLIPTPPPLTTPLLAPSATAELPTPTRSPSSGHNILPVALGAGIGAGLGVIIIGIVIAYFVIKKKRIERRKSMPLMRLQPGAEMKKTEPDTRVDRSEHGNAVGKKKDPAASPPAQGHKKTDSVGVRSVRFGRESA
ncbi:hypothetical protein Dda_6231 [Drechslerella dactyloides]|uniref:Uncharacterized protein n=1 Tax=Drechslerella dactyloides TaxID=74499 RepID=A0AAD6NH41_DREDA|nr:hypothetical protein Dda_6231 [Drechslerella dactyloides]